MLFDAIVHSAWLNATCPEVHIGVKKQNKTKKQRWFPNRLDFIGVCVFVAGFHPWLHCRPLQLSANPSVRPVAGKVIEKKWFPLSWSCSAPQHLSVVITHEKNTMQATSPCGMSAFGHHGPLDTFWMNLPFWGEVRVGGGGGGRRR